METVSLGVTEIVGVGVTDIVEVGVTDIVEVGVTEIVILGVSEGVTLGVIDIVGVIVGVGLGVALIPTQSVNDVITPLASVIIVYSKPAQAIICPPGPVCNGEDNTPRVSIVYNFIPTAIFIPSAV
jgi:hypothetical protein